MFKLQIVHRFVLAPLLLGALASPCLAQSRGGNDCFLARNVSNFSSPDASTVYLRVGANQFWKLDLMENCLRLTRRGHIGIRANGASPWICRPIQATITNRTPGATRRCSVTGMRRLTPDEVAAIPSGLRP